MNDFAVAKPLHDDFSWLGAYNSHKISIELREKLRLLGYENENYPA